MNRYSIVGMMLVIVSAIMTTFIPSQASTDPGKDLPGTMVLSEGQEDWTCTLGVDIRNCDYSITGLSLTDSQTYFSFVNSTNTDDYTTIIEW